jgi:mono/diheme cytochrome c family protein
MGRRCATGLALAAIAGSLTGCGGTSAPAPPSGRVLFARDCASCHSLSGVDDPRLQGGDLLAFHSSRAQLRQLTREMPVRHALDQGALRTLVDYVMAVERSGG